MNILQKQKTSRGNKKTVRASFKAKKESGLLTPRAYLHIASCSRCFSIRRLQIKKFWKENDLICIKYLHKSRSHATSEEHAKKLTGKD